MITIFNRRELFLTYDMERQIAIRVLLRSNNIDCRVKVTNLLHPSPFTGSPRVRTGTLGLDLSKTYEYKFYVRKSDYERAKYLLDQAR